MEATVNEETSDLLIRRVPKSVLEALSTKAGGVDQDRMEFVRKMLISASGVPERYAYRIYGQVGKGAIRRFTDHVNGTSSPFANFNQDEADAVNRAEDFIRRNAPGDKEKAYQLLVSQFGEDQVFEIPV